MMTFCKLLAASLTLAATLSSAAGTIVVDLPTASADRGVVFDFDLFVANDLVALRDFDADPWPGNYRTRTGANLAVVSTRASAGLDTRYFGVRLIRRAEALLISSADTAHAHVLAQNDQLFATPRQLDINYAMTGFEADGARFSAYAPKVSSTAGSTLAGLSLNVLRGLRFRSEYARGRFVTDGTVASLNGTRELWYSDLRPSSSSGLSAFHPFAGEAVPRYGQGRSIDVGIEHTFPGDIRLGFAINDLAGYMRWKGIPHMSQKFEINNVSESSYNSSGNPAVSGYHNYVDLNATLDIKRALELTAPFASHWTGRARISRVRGQDFPEIGIAWAFGDAGALEADYETRFGSLALGFRAPHWSVGLRADRLDLAAARTLGVRLAAQLPF